jgi:hypothetical protein
MFLLLFHIKTLRAFLIDSIKLRFLMLKSRKTVSVLVRYGSRFYEKLALKQQNGKIYIAVEFALLRKRSQKYGTVTVGYGTVRYGTDTVDG